MPLLRLKYTHILKERLSKRREIFSKMDVNGNGTISFDEWLDYAFRHIVCKVATLV